METMRVPLILLFLGDSFGRYTGIPVLSQSGHLTFTQHDWTANFWLSQQAKQGHFL